MPPTRALLTVIALSLFATAASCPTTPDAGTGRLAVQRAKWRSQAIRHYRYEFQRTCECLPDMAPPALIEVKDGAIVSVTHAQTGESLANTSAANRPTIEELFGELQRAFREADRVDVTYDRVFGYPSRVNIDWDVNVADEERIYGAKNLTPLP